MQKVRHAAKICSVYWADRIVIISDPIKEILAYYCYSYAL